MKKNWLLLTVTLILLNACKQGRQGLVLSSMIEIDPTVKEFDTTTFTSKEGKLTSIKDKYQVIDSMTYDEEGRLVGHKWQEILTNKTISKCSIHYSNDSVTKIEIPVAYTGNQTVTVYKLSNGRPVMKYLRDEERRDTTTYTYNKNGDIINIAERTYFDNKPFNQNTEVSYPQDYIQPYNTLGDQLFWELIYQSPVMGAGKFGVTSGVLVSDVTGEKGKLPLTVTIEENVEQQGQKMHRKTLTKFFYTKS